MPRNRILFDSLAGSDPSNFLLPQETIEMKILQDWYSEALPEGLQGIPGNGVIVRVIDGEGEVPAGAPE